MAKEIALENSWISNFEELVTLTFDWVILHTATHHSLKSNKLFVIGRTYVHMHGHI